MSAPESVASIASMKAWESRRTHEKIWTRTESMRWLDERSAEGVLWLQGVEKTAKPRRSKQFGSWLMINRAADFNRAHDRLTLNRHEGVTLRSVLKP